LRIASTGGNFLLKTLLDVLEATIYGTSKFPRANSFTDSLVPRNPGVCSNRSVTFTITYYTSSGKPCTYPFSFITVRSARGNSFEKYAPEPVGAVKLALYLTPVAPALLLAAVALTLI
jgi:hypothetical protein